MKQAVFAIAAALLLSGCALDAMGRPPPSSWSAPPQPAPRAKAVKVAKAPAPAAIKPVATPSPAKAKKHWWQR